jgi:hypothetical protein
LTSTLAIYVSPAITISKTAVHSTKSSYSKLQRIQDISAKESEVIFLKKREAHSLVQVAYYGVQINPNGRPSIPSTPYPPKTPCSMRPEFG